MSFLIRRPALLVVLALALAAICGVGIDRYRFEPSWRAYLEPRDPLLADFDAVRGAFDSTEVLLVLVEAVGGDVLSPSGLALVRHLTERAATLPHVRRVDSLTNFQVAAGDADAFAMSELLTAGDIDDEAAAAARARALGDPLVNGRLVDAAGRLAVVALTLDADMHSLADIADLHADAEDLLDASQRPGFELHLSGPLAMNYAFAASTLTDTLQLLPLALVLLFLIVAIISGSVLAAAYVLLLSALSVAVGMGIGGWLNVPLTTASALAPIVIVTIAVANGVHVLVSLQAAHDEVPASFEKRLAASLANNRGPIALTAASTAIGFLTMNLSDMPPLQDLGLLVAIGAVAAGVLSLTWLPALVRLRPPLLRPRAQWYARHALLVTTQPRRVLLALPVLLVVVMAGLPRLYIDEDFVHWFAPQNAFGTAARVQSEHLGGLNEIEFLLESGAPGGVHDPRYLALVDGLAAFARAQRETRHVLAWTDVLRSVAASVDAGAKLPDAVATAAQYLLLYQMALPPGFDANHLVDVQESATRLRIALGDVPSSALLDVEARVVDWWTRHAGGLHEQHGGVNLMFAHLAVRNAESMIEGDVLIVIVTGVLLALALRSVLLGCLSLAMNLMPVIVAFSLWGLWSGAVGLALSTATGVTLGIVVDDTVHLLMRYRRQRQSGKPPAVAMQAALTGAAPALVATTVALTAGFCVLALSTFQLNAHLGALAASTIVLALLLDLLLVPALIVMLDEWRLRARAGSVAPPA